MCELTTWSSGNLIIAFTIHLVLATQSAFMTVVDYNQTKGDLMGIDMKNE